LGRGEKGRTLLPLSLKGEREKDGGRGWDKGSSDWSKRLKGKGGKNSLPSNLIALSVERR